ncbi:MAG: LysR family transcriptional regulator [Burkholderiaceae bacterium]
MLRGLTLKQIETFYWTATLGSFTAAAARLNTTQPAISNRIREFELATDAKLFDPAVRLPRVTAKGREVLAVCEQFLNLARTLEKSSGSIPAVGGLVRVGAADTVALTWLPMLMSRLAEQYPQIDVELIVDLSLHLQTRLESRELDIAFLVGPIGDPKIATRHLGNVRNAWMCAPSLLRGHKKTLSPKEMAQIPIFTHSRGTHLHQAMARWFEEHGLRPTRVHGCNSLSTMIRMTIAGLGLSVLPIDMMQEEIGEKRLAVLSSRTGIPPNRFLVAHQSDSFDATMTLISDLAVELAHANGIFHP